MDSKQSHPTPVGSPTAKPDLAERSSTVNSSYSAQNLSNENSPISGVPFTPNHNMGSNGHSPHPVPLANGNGSATAPAPTIIGSIPSTNANGVGLGLEEAEEVKPGKPQRGSLEEFLARPMPPKEPLIEGLLYRRDLVAIIGRRRNGKTSFAANMAMAATSGLKQWLGYSIPKPFRVLAIFLEDDPTELRDKLSPMKGGLDTAGRLHIRTKEDFQRRDAQLTIKDKKMVAVLHEFIKETNPDLIILDNLGFLVDGEYNEPKVIHQLVTILNAYQKGAGMAIAVLAHPKKMQEVAIKMKMGPEMFFEQCMGSSHFINSFGSLWGLERDERTDVTLFCGGAQRVDGTQSFTTLNLREDHWFEVQDDIQERYMDVMTTTKREKAWTALPSAGNFTYTEARTVTEPFIKGNAFNSWWKTCIRLGLILEHDEGQFTKNPRTGRCSRPVVETTEEPPSGSGKRWHSKGSS